MKRYINNILIIITIFLLTGCSNDFLLKNQNPITFPMGLSNIVVSPGWENNNLAIKIPYLKDASFEITSKPDWINFSSLKGQLADSIAIFDCTVTENPDFSKPGIYTDFLTIKANNTIFKVPVSYITEGNPKLTIMNSPALSYDFEGNLTLNIHNNGEGVLVWGINSMPDWLELDTARIKFDGMFIKPYTAYSIPLKISTDDLSSNTLSGTIVLNSNDKSNLTKSIEVSIQPRRPNLNINTTTITFANTETTKTLSFNNNGYGNLIWSFEDIPVWLKISPDKGVYKQNTIYNNVTLTCDRSKLEPGQNSAVIKLKTNDINKQNYLITVTATAPGSNKDVKLIDGSVVDAYFNKNTNTIYYVTSLPNKLIIFDVKNRTVLNEILLSKAPTCLAISEDWKTAAVGHNGFLSAVNLTNNTVTALYTLNYSVNDIAWAENDWFAFTQKGGSFSALHWINTSNGSLYDDPKDNTSLDGASTVKKVPNQPYLIATRGASSPSGFYAYSIATKSKKSYSHMTLSNFWMSETGEYVFARNLYIYRTSSSTGSSDSFNNNINEIGKINLGSTSYYGLQHLYHSNKNLWAIQLESYSSNTSTTGIYQVEDNDYSLIKKITYITLLQPDQQTNAYYVSANYVFSNSDDSELSVFCKGEVNNSWNLQFIKVN
jgi:hypothetical protein